MQSPGGMACPPAIVASYRTALASATAAMVALALAMVAMAAMAEAALWREGGVIWLEPRIRGMMGCVGIPATTLRYLPHSLGSLTARLSTKGRFSTLFNVLLSSPALQ